MMDGDDGLGWTAIPTAPQLPSQLPVRAGLLLLVFARSGVSFPPPKCLFLAQLWVLSNNTVFLPKLNVSTGSFRNTNTKIKATSLAAALPTAFFLDAPWKKQKAQTPGPTGG